MHRVRCGDGRVGPSTGRRIGGSAASRFDENLSPTDDGHTFFTDRGGGGRAVRKQTGHMKVERCA